MNLFNELPCLFCCQPTPVILTKTVYNFAGKIKEVRQALNIADPPDLSNLSKAPFCQDCIGIIKDVSELRKRIDNLLAQLGLKTDKILALLKKYYEINVEDERKVGMRFSLKDLRKRLAQHLKVTHEEDSPELEDKDSPALDIEIENQNLESEIENFPAAPGTFETKQEFIEEPGELSEFRSELFDDDHYYSGDEDPANTTSSNNNNFPFSATQIKNSQSTPEFPKFHPGQIKNINSTNASKAVIKSENRIKIKIPPEIKIRDCSVRLKRLPPEECRTRKVSLHKSKLQYERRKRKKKGSSRNYIVCNYIFPGTPKRHCLRQFADEEERKVHFEKVHINNENEKVCPYCSRTYTRYHGLRIHLRKHLGEGNPLTRTRKKLPKTTNNTEEKPPANNNEILEPPDNENIDQPCHQSESENQNGFVCSKYISTQSKARGRCNREFDNEADLKVHYKQAHSNRKICSQCSRSFANLKSLTLHLRLHTGECKFPCETCGDKFRSDYLLVKHRIKVHNAPHPYSCDLCSEKFYRAIELKYHSYVHTGNWPYLCEQCSFGTFNLISLQRHKDFNHFEKNAPKISCSVCNKTCYSEYQLRKHSKIHVDSRPWKCSECPSTFKIRGTLNAHVKTVHPAGRPFLCQLCGADFKAERHLLSHIKGHPTRKMAFAKRNRQKNRPPPFSHPADELPSELVEPQDLGSNPEALETIPLFLDTEFLDTETEIAVVEETI